MVPVLPDIEFFLKPKKFDQQTKREAVHECLRLVNPEQDLFIIEQFQKYLSNLNPFSRYEANVTLVNRVNALNIYLNFAKYKFIKGLNKTIFEADYAKHILNCYVDCIERKLSITPGQFYIILAIAFWIRSKLSVLSLGKCVIDSLEADFDNPEINIFHGEIKEAYKQIYDAVKKQVKNVHVRECIEEFLDSVQAYPVHCHLPINMSSERRILILGKLAGGGHRTAMLALEKLFKDKGAVVLAMEMNELEDRYDVLCKRNARFEDGTLMSRLTLYNRWTGVEKKEALWELLQIFSEYMRETFPDTYKIDWGKDLIKIITDFKPDIILTTVGQPSELAWVAGRVNRPFVYFHTDPIFNPDAYNLYRTQKLLPPEFRLFTIASHLTDQNEYPPGIDWKDPCIEITGVPCREEFVPVASPEALAEKRKKWGCYDHEIVYSISRGLFGATEHIMHAVNELLDPNYPIDQPMRVIIVCGRNKQLQHELESLASSFPKASKPLRFIITGELSGAEMAEVLQISDIPDFKAGGATIIEYLSVVGSEPSLKRAIMTPEHALEVVNAVHVVKKGLGLMYNRRNPNQPHRMELIKQLLKNHTPVTAPVLDWRTIISEMVERKIKLHQQTFGAL